MWANRVTGLSLALIDEQEVVWATGWGEAEVDAHRPATPRTVYDVGSLAKPITAAALLQAVERGELSLDDPLAEHLPRLSFAGAAEDEITLESLLTHQSGLPSDWLREHLSEHPRPWMAVIDEINGLQPAFEPRTLTLYSNLGMTLAGAALAEASGRSYEEVVTEALLRPAGMRTAYFDGGPEPEPVLLPISGGPRGLAAIERAAAYDMGEARSAPRFRLAPAGGLHASVLDLAAFARLILGRGRVGGRQLLSPAHVDAMLSAHNEDLALDLDHRFGYAWFLNADELDWVGRVVSHGGRTVHHHALLIILPDHGLAVAVASNSLTAASTVQALAEQTLIFALQEKHGLVPPDPPDQPTRPMTPATTPERLQAFSRANAGDYATSIGLATIAMSTQPSQRGELWYQAKAGSSRLYPSSADAASADALRGAKIHFVDVDVDLSAAQSLAHSCALRTKDGDTAAHVMTFERAGRRHRAGVELPPPPPLSAAWRARLGRWEPVLAPKERAAIREPALTLSGGRLQFEFLGVLENPPVPVVMILEPLDDQRARVLGLARGQGVIIEVRDEGDGERLWWAGRSLRRMTL
nr:serine hydrolase domain-containing protein [Pseudenhygromyxa sp. WMMC2535]